MGFIPDIMLTAISHRARNQKNDNDTWTVRIGTKTSLKLPADALLNRFIMERRLWWIVKVNCWHHMAIPMPFHSCVQRPNHFRLCRSLKWVEMKNSASRSSEIGLICASHSGTDEHLAALQKLQAKIGVTEADLLCGTHTPFYKPTADALILKGEKPTPNRHNCSGKHTGMLAHAKLRGQPIQQYLDLDISGAAEYFARLRRNVRIAG